MKKTILFSIILGLLFICCNNNDDPDIKNNEGNIEYVQIFPSNNRWNTNISNDPVDPNSVNLIANSSDCLISNPILFTLII